MNGYIKYFDDGGKNMSFKTEDDNIFSKCNEIWNKTKMILNIKFHSQPTYDEKYIQTKVKTINYIINTDFSDNDIQKERNHCTCIAAVNIDSVMKIDKINYSQIYLEQCKDKEKKEKGGRFY